MLYCIHYITSCHYVNHTIFYHMVSYHTIIYTLYFESISFGGFTPESNHDFIFGGCKITADGDCSHEIKRRLLLGRKVMTNPYSIFKSRDITLPTKVRLVKALVFPVVMYGCASWTVKKAEH